MWSFWSTAGRVVHTGGTSRCDFYMLSANHHVNMLSSVDDSSAPLGQFSWFLWCYCPLFGPVRAVHYWTCIITAVWDKTKVVTQKSLCLWEKIQPKPSCCWAWSTDCMSVNTVHPPSMYNWVVLKFNSSLFIWFVQFWFIFRNEDLTRQLVKVHGFHSKCLQLLEQELLGGSVRLF